MNKEDVLKLANLSRLELNDQELNKYATEMSGILNYVEQINTALSDSDESTNVIENAGARNVFREDVNSDAPETHTDAILKCAPHVQDNFIKVQKILNNENGSN